MRDLLMGVRVLLVLTEHDEETMALAHRTLPTYITDADHGLAEVLSVLEKLTRAERATQGARQE